MYCLVLFAFFWGTLAENVKYYDTYTGNIITDEEYKQHVKENTTFWCTGTFEDCKPNEGRRMDLTCSNLQFPTRGASHSPFIRMLPALWGKDYEPVKKKNGQPMPLARKVRQQTLIEGDIPDQHFTIAFTNYLLFTLATQTSFHDTINFMVWTPNCCKAGVKKDPMCYPNLVPSDDTVHQFSGVRCLNQTKPLTFQTQGCLKDKNTKPQRINSASSYYDLNNVYGFDNTQRSFEDGMLKTEVENGIVWPVSAKPNEGNCLQNDQTETRCHARGPLNSLFGVNFFGMQFWREHNYIAKELKKQNPSWDDEKLFTIAREINIAFFTQIFYYELLPPFMGKDNLIKDGIISKHGGFRNTFKKDLAPQMAIEYSYVMRWGHTILPGLLKMYDDSGNYLKQIPITNLTLRTGYLAKDDHMLGVGQGSFRQPAGKIDHVVDPVVAETGLGNLQYAFDIPTADLSKAGLQGIANYVSFREFCTGRKYRGFADLARDIDPEYIEMIKLSHEDISDIPLMLGVWLEKPIEGGFAPRTLYCIASKQYKRFTEYDRFWYELEDRPNAFTKRQLAEIRKMTVARLLCDVGDGITKITPNAFFREGPNNKIVSCDKIKKIDYSAWKSC